MRTVQVAKSIVTFLMGVDSGPGLMTPDTFWPSQVITTVRRRRSLALGPQLPAHVPESGCPSCACPMAAVQAHARASRNIRNGARNLTAERAERAENIICLFGVLCEFAGSLIHPDRLARHPEGYELRRV